MVLRERSSGRLRAALAAITLAVALVAALTGWLAGASWPGILLIALATAAAELLCLRLFLYRLDRWLRARLAQDTVMLTRPPVELAGGADDLEGRFRAARQSIDTLAERAERMRALADSAFGLEALFDAEGRLLWISPNVAACCGLSVEECLAAGDPVELLVFEPDRAYFRFNLEKIIAAGAQAGLHLSEELRLNAPGGTRWMHCHWSSFGVEESAAGVGARLSAQDIQSRKETEYTLLETVAQLRRAQALSEHYLGRSNDERQRLSALLNVMHQGILFMGPDFRVEYCNAAFLGLWGYAPAENLMGQRDVVWQSRLARLMVEPERFMEHVRTVSGSGGVSGTVELLLLDGRTVTCRSAVVEGAEGRAPIGRVWIYEDVTEQRNTARQLVEMAERDVLTGLFNRRRFHEEIERMLAEAARRGLQVGLVMIDLDGFKPINDRYGHAAGDTVLVELAHGVARVIRRNEMFFRLGGDEFAILVPDTDPLELEELAHRLVEFVAQMRFQFGDEQAHITASIGLALFPRNALDAEGLLAAADRAMYASKEGGRNRWTLYSGCFCAEPAGTPGFSDKMPASPNTSDPREE